MFWEYGFLDVAAGFVCFSFFLLNLFVCVCVCVC